MFFHMAEYFDTTQTKERRNPTTTTIYARHEADRWKFVLYSHGVNHCKARLAKSLKLTFPSALKSAMLSAGQPVHSQLSVKAFRCSDSTDSEAYKSQGAGGMA